MSERELAIGEGRCLCGRTTTTIEMLENGGQCAICNLSKAIERMNEFWASPAGQKEIEEIRKSIEEAKDEGTNSKG